MRTHGKRWKKNWIRSMRMALLENHSGGGWLLYCCYCWEPAPSCGGVVPRLPTIKRQRLHPITQLLCRSNKRKATPLKKKQRQIIQIKLNNKDLLFREKSRMQLLPLCFYPSQPKKKKKKKNTSS